MKELTKLCGFLSKHPRSDISLSELQYQLLFAQEINSLRKRAHILRSANEYNIIFFSKRGNSIFNINFEKVDEYLESNKKRRKY